jgi:VanZ family protein
LRLWLWALICAIGIFITVPIARSLQKFVYDSVGKEFFTYTVLFVIISVLTASLYFLIFRLKVKNFSQYFWLIASGGLYVYFTLQLKEHPEEAVHFLEYGLLSFFIFKALSHRIRDWTIYIITIFFVSIVGITDEFIQWLLPSRFWGYKDVGIDALAAGIFMLVIWQGIKPKTISSPVQKISLKMLCRIISLNLLLLGLCLSNTPETVNSYTSIFTSLSWLRNEEPMTEFESITVSLTTIWLIIASLLITVWIVSRKWVGKLDL